MSPREAAARAMAFFEASDDVALLHQLLGEIAPRARKMVGKQLASGGEDSVPAPAELRPAKEAAGKDEALKTLRAANDFALLQVMARSIGQRVEAIEVAASAEFPEGARVSVPEKPTFPASGRRLQGTVETTGTMLQVLLDNGETWQGPPSLAALAGRR